MRKRLIPLVGVLLILAGCSSTANLSATFDGETCTYSGPDAVRSDEIDATFVNRSDEPAALSFISLQDESARADELALIGTRITVEGALPGPQVRLAGVLEANPGQEATRDAPLSPGTYFLDCVTFDGPAPDEVWRIAVVEVDA